jgi:hypothetical protein
MGPLQIDESVRVRALKILDNIGLCGLKVERESL